MFSAITVDYHETWSVDDTGGRKELLDQRRSAWSCREHGMSFASWDLVIHHLTQQHDYRPNGGTPPGGHREFVQTSESIGMELS